MSLKRVVVTGASGFVGGAVATALAEAGHQVTGLGRRANGWSHPRGAYRALDLTRDPLEVLSGADVVIHSAALADDWAEWDAAFDANVRVTGRIVQTTDARLIHISSASVYDAYSANVQADERDPLPRRYPAAYGATKALAERIAAIHPNSIALRPHAVYGPGDTTLLPRLMERVRLGTLALPGGGRVLHTVTHIDTLIAAVEASLHSTLTGPMNVGDATPVQLAEFIREALALSGRRARIVSVPVGVAMALASRAEGLARVTGRRPSLTRYAVGQVGFERTLALGRLHDELGVAPREPSLDFMRRGPA